MLSMTVLPRFFVTIKKKHGRDYSKQKNEQIEVSS